MRLANLLHTALATSALIAGCASSGSHAVDRPASPTSDSTPHPIHWVAWSDDVFERARAEHRFVLLDLEAVWCHWCHVMEATTYSDPAVRALIAERYIAVKVDQDSRPDLSNRYEDYGWPATIVFAPDGSEIAKRSGYIPPPAMASLLQAIIDDPTPGPSVERTANVVPAVDAVLAPELAHELEQLQHASYDDEHGGFGRGHKYLDAPSLEFAIARGLDGEPDWLRMARETLDRNLALIDPVWGGVYQYSAGGDWNEPHFEKIMSFQSDDLRVYSLAYSAFGDERYADAARSIQRYLREFLTSPGGAFYTSQDADLVPGEHSAEYFALGDAERRQRGVPRVDTHIYARENGWAIRALIALYAATGDANARQAAERSAHAMLTTRSLAGGGFRHDEKDAAGPYLGDTLAMGQSFLALYETTGEREWLTRAIDAAGFIREHFVGDGRTPGIATVQLSTRSVSAAAAQPPQRGENVEATRFANLLYHYTGDAAHAALADHGLRWLCAPEVARRPFTAGVLLAAAERARSPVHVTVVGPKEDPRTGALVRAALRLPTSYRRIDQLDLRGAPLPNTDVEYPELDRPAAFACAGERCSSPAFEPADVAARVKALR